MGFGGGLVDRLKKARGRNDRASPMVGSGSLDSHLVSCPVSSSNNGMIVVFEKMPPVGRMESNPRPSFPISALLLGRWFACAPLRPCSRANSSPGIGFQNGIRPTPSARLELEKDCSRIIQTTSLTAH